MPKDHPHNTVPLPVFATLAKAFQRPFQYLNDLFLLTYPFILMSLALAVFPYNYEQMIDGNWFDDRTHQMLALLWLALWLGYLATGVMAAVNCHRLYLNKSEKRASLKAFAFSSREWRYIGWSILLAVLTILLVIPFGILAALVVDFAEETTFTTGILTYVIMMPAFYLMARWLVCLPATSLGLVQISLSWCMELSRGNGLRLMALVMIVPMLTSWVFEAWPATSMAINIVQQLTYCLVLAIEVALLSFSYDFLIRYNPPKQTSVITTDVDDPVFSGR